MCPATTVFDIPTVFDILLHKNRGCWTRCRRFSGHYEGISRTTPNLPKITPHTPPDLPQNYPTDNTVQLRDHVRDLLLQDAKSYSGKGDRLLDNFLEKVRKTTV